MAFKEGDKVVIVRALEGGRYFHGGYTSGVPLKSKGKVTYINGINSISIELNNGEDWDVHPKEIRLANANENSQLDGLPLPYVFSLASQTPLFLINDRLYIADDTNNSLKSNFFQTSNDGKVTRQKLVESASLASLEELTQAHNAKKFERIEKQYIQEITENRSYDEENSKYKLIDFIVNEVFPYFRSEGGNSTKIDKLLGITHAAEAKKSGAPPQKPKKQSRKEALVSKLVGEIEGEKFHRQGKEQKKTKKLDALLGYNSLWDITDFPQDYEPTSLLGQVIAGRNAAVIDNFLYSLVWTNNDSHKKILNLEGKNFALTSPKPLDEAKARYDFELSKRIRINALIKKLAHDQQFQKLAQRNTDIASLARKKEYREGNFGFIRDDDSYDEASYWVFLQVPKHVIKMPDDYPIGDDEDYDGYYDKPRRRPKKKTDRYYAFGKVRVAVRVFVEYEKISYNEEPVTVEEYEHPFTKDCCEYGGICLGDYNYNKLSKLSRGEAVARLLTDTRQTLLSGYISGNTQAAQLLDSFEDNRITLSKIRKSNIPITNINLKKGRRRR